MPLTRDQLRAAGQPKTQTLDVPEWGGQVVVRELTLAEQQLVESAPKDATGAAVKIILAAMVEPSLSPEDADMLRALGHSGLQRVTKTILALSGMVAGAQAAAQGK